MTTQEAIELFSKLSPRRKASFLLRFAFEVTVVARDSYEVGTENIVDQPLLRAANELQHQLLAHIRDLLDGKPRRDDVEFVQYMTESHHEKFTVYLKHGLVQVATRFERNTVPDMQSVEA